MNPRRPALLLLLLLGPLSFAACQTDRAVIRVDGSSTVFPLTEAAAEEFIRETRAARVNVGFSGTGGGFEKLCRGDIQVSGASRPIRESELQTCANNGITDLIELEVAIDALTIVVNPQNDFADCLTVREVHEIFRTGGAERWSDMRLGWPDRRIDTFYPGTDSGTFDYFVETIIEEVDEDATHRGDGTASEDDNVLAIGVSHDRTAIGYFGFAFFQDSRDALKAVEIDGGAGCVEPSEETVLDGSYVPLSRPLHIYTRERLLRDRPMLLEWVRFYLEHAPEFAREVGYVPLSSEQIDDQLEKLPAAREPATRLR